MSNHSDPNHNFDPAAPFPGQPKREQDGGSWLFEGDDQPAAQAPQESMGDYGAYESEPAHAAREIVPYPEDDMAYSGEYAFEGSLGENNDGSGPASLSASYCEPDSPASMARSLLVPGVFVAAIAVGGLVLWKSMSGMPQGDGNAHTAMVQQGSRLGDGADLRQPEGTKAPVKTAKTREESTRASILRDGSVAAVPSKTDEPAVAPKRGFTPSPQSQPSHVEPQLPVEEPEVSEVHLAEVLEVIEGDALEPMGETSSPNPLYNHNWLSMAPPMWGPLGPDLELYGTSPAPMMGGEASTDEVAMVELEGFEDPAAYDPWASMEDDVELPFFFEETPVAVVEPVEEVEVALVEVPVYDETEVLPVEAPVLELAQSTEPVEDMPEILGWLPIPMGSGLAMSLLYGVPAVDAVIEEGDDSMLAEVEAETPVDNGELLLPETGGALRMPGESVQPAITDRVELIAVEMPGESSTDSEEDAGLLPGDGEEKLAQLEWSIGEDANSDLPRFEIDELSIESEVAMLSPVLGSPNLWLGEGALSIDPTTQVDSAEVLAVEPGQDDPSLVAEGPVFEVDENLLVGPEPGSNPFGESALLTQETGENPATETSGADVQGELSPGTETPAVPEPVAVHGNPTVETPVVAQAGEPAEGQGGLLDLYAEWTVLDDQGQVQEMAPLAWMGTAGGPVGTLPFGVAQQGEGQPVAQAQDPKVTEKDDQEATTRRKGVLRRREQTVDHWTGTEIPMHALKGSEVLLTPNVGPVRVIATAGETIEGRLHGLGQGYVWLENNLGKMTVPARRIERIERIDPNQYRDDRSTQMDYTKLPKVRVRMKGGVFVGYQLAREGNRITIRTEQGAKLTLVSDDIRPAGSYKAVGLRRDGEAAESGDE